MFYCQQRNKQLKLTSSWYHHDRYKRKSISNTTKINTILQVIVVIVIGHTILTVLKYLVSPSWLNLAWNSPLSVTSFDVLQIVEMSAIPFSKARPPWHRTNLWQSCRGFSPLEYRFYQGLQQAELDSLINTN